MDNFSPHSQHKEFSKPCVPISLRSRAAPFVTPREQFQALQTHLSVHHKHKLLQPRQGSALLTANTLQQNKCHFTARLMCSCQPSFVFNTLHCFMLLLVLYSWENKSKQHQGSRSCSRAGAEVENSLEQRSTARTAPPLAAAFSKLFWIKF